MKLLVILSRLPYPLEKGDKLRAFNQLKELSKNNEIFLVAINDSPMHPDAMNVLQKFCRHIKVIHLSKVQIAKNLASTVFSTLPFQVGYFYWQQAQNDIDDVIQHFKPEHIYCQLIRTSEYVKKHTSIPKTLDYMDVFSKGIERRVKKEPLFTRPLWITEYKRLLKYEHYALTAFNHCTIISEQDRDLIPHERNKQIVVIPNGVDMDYFRPFDIDKKFELLFNGNMSYPPNVESVEFLVKKVMPLVWKELPGTKLLISGASPSQRVLNLASDKVIISGWVEDIRTNFAQSKILVAPMQISIGLQNKLLEAMAMKIPCITSSLANNALNAVHNESILVADKPEEYSGCIIDLLQNQQKAGEIAEEGFKFARKNFDWSSTTSRLEVLMKS